jgi:hypothetical protein
MEHGVAPEKRIYDPCEIEEFHNHFAKVTEHLHENSTQALLTSI